MNRERNGLRSIYKTTDITLGANCFSIDLVVYLKLFSGCLIFGLRPTNECRFGLQTGLDAQRPDQTVCIFSEAQKCAIDQCVSIDNYSFSCACFFSWFRLKSNVRRCKHLNCSCVNENAY